MFYDLVGPGFPQGAGDAERPAAHGDFGAGRHDGTAGSGGAEAAARPGDEPADDSRETTRLRFLPKSTTISRASSRARSTRPSRLTSESGQEVFSARDTIANPSTAGSHWTTVRASTREVPLKSVPPGRYLLRVEAKLRGNSAPLSRETLITVQ